MEAFWRFILRGGPPRVLLMASGGCNCLEPPARISAMALRAGGANAAGEGHLSVWMGACVSVLRKTIAMVVKGDMVGVQRLLGLRVAGLCVRVAQLSMRVRSPVCVAAPVAIQPDGFNMVGKSHPSVWMCACVRVLHDDGWWSMATWYSFSGSGGGLGGLSSLRSVKGLRVLHSVAQQAFEGDGGPTHPCGWVHMWVCFATMAVVVDGCMVGSFKVTGAVGGGAVCAFCIAHGVCVHVDAPVCSVGCVRSPVATQVFKGGGVLSRDVPLAADGAAGAQELNSGSVVDGARARCAAHGVQAVGERVQWQRGRPRRPLLAAFIWKASCAALAHAAGGSRAAVRSCAACRHVVDGLQAVVVWPQQWRGRPLQPLLAAIE